MKKFIFSLIGLLSLGGIAKAETVDISTITQRVVEIHMTSTANVAEPTKKKHRGDASKVPMPGAGTCSGAFIDGQGDILTAKHCVEGFDSFEVMTADRRLFMATIVGKSRVHDLAMLHIDFFGTPHFDTIAHPVQGTAIAVLGSPLGFTGVFTTGTIAKLAGDEIYLDCGVLPGNSGGPVFDKDGSLVGTVTAGFVVLLGTTHLNVAQGPDAILAFIVETLSKTYGR